MLGGSPIRWRSTNWVTSLYKFLDKLVARPIISVVYLLQPAICVENRRPQVVADGRSVVPKFFVERFAKLCDFSFIARQKMPVRRIVMLGLGVMEQGRRRIVFGIKTDAEQHPIFRRIAALGQFLLRFRKIIIHARTEIGERTPGEEKRHGERFASEVRRAQRLPKFVGQMKVGNGLTGVERRDGLGHLDV
jgi:hypothetical protein